MHLFKENFFFFLNCEFSVYKNYIFKVIYVINLEDTENELHSIEFTVHYQHRTWNHICLTYKGDTGDLNFYFNEHTLKKSFSPNKFHVFGSPHYSNQFLGFGQEPDSFKGGYDTFQLLRGKISQFNWWNYVIEETEIKELANCMKEGKGNIVDWDKTNFITHSIDIDEVDPRIFCDSSETWMFFPGRRRLSQALDLCTAHGGWIVVPNSQKENTKAMNIYKDNIKSCKQEGLEEIGWLGVNYYAKNYYIPKSNKFVKTNFNNFER